MPFQKSGSIAALVVTLAGCDPSSGGREPESASVSSRESPSVGATRLTLVATETTPVRVGTQSSCPSNPDPELDSGCVAPGEARFTLSLPANPTAATLELRARCTSVATGSVLPELSSGEVALPADCQDGSCVPVLPWNGYDPNLSGSEHQEEQHYDCEAKAVLRFTNRFGLKVTQRDSMAGVPWVVQPYLAAASVTATSATEPTVQTMPVEGDSVAPDEPVPEVAVGAYEDTEQTYPDTDDPTQTQTETPGSASVGVSTVQVLPPTQDGLLPYFVADLYDFQPHGATFGQGGLLLGLQPSGTLKDVGPGVLSWYDEDDLTWRLCDGSSPSDCVPVACPAGSPADMVCGNVFHFSTWTLIVKSGTEAEVPIRLSLGLSGGAPVSWSCGGAPSGRCPTEMATKFVWSLPASPAGPSPSKIAVLVETESGPSSWEALADLDASASASGTVLVNPGAAVVSPNSFTDGTTQLELQNLYTPGWVPIKVSVSALSVCQALYPNKTCPTGVQVTNNTSGTNCSATVLPQNTTSTELIECINLEVIPDVTSAMLSYAQSGGSNTLSASTSSSYTAAQNLQANGVPVSVSWESTCSDETAGRQAALGSVESSATSAAPDKVNFSTSTGSGHSSHLRLSMDTNTQEGYPAVKGFCVAVSDDQDGDLHAGAQDCDDGDATVYAGAPELCDEVDNDCDDSTDEGVTTGYYPDADGDGYGSDSASANQACTAPVATATNNRDCNDNNPNVKPGAQEVCDGQNVDEDCDGLADDADVSVSSTGKVTYYKDADEDGYGLTSSSSLRCDPDLTYTTTVGGDCKDTNDAIHPGATELTGDSSDQNCDGAEICFKDADNDGFRPDSTSTVTSTDTDCADANEATSTDPTTDCNDSNAAVKPGAIETCNSIDDDCDGAIDEAVTITYYQDADGDGYGTTNTTQACSKPTGYATVSGDCNDSDAAVKPGATEVTGDSKDQNCDGLETCFKDADNDGYRPDTTSTVASIDKDCADANEAVSTDPTTDCNDADAAVKPGATEVCADGIDNNCDKLGCQPAGVYQTLTAQLSLTGEYAGQWYGRSLASAGDLNGDGYEDVLACADGDDGGGADSGAAYLYYGPITSSRLASNADAVILGEHASEYTAYRCDGIGDFNGDGNDDLVLGAHHLTRNGSDNGGAYVVFGPVYGTLSLGDADMTLIGEAPGDEAGISVSAAGDVNQDGLDDILVGAWHASVSGSGSGAGYLVLGRTAPVSILSLSQADARVAGEAAGDVLGWDVASAGDVNGDGYGDIMVGAASNDRGGAEAGAAYLFYGPLSGKVSASAAGAILVGEQAGDSASRPGVGIGDINLDGYDDILVGARGNDQNGADAGAAYIVYGPLSGSRSLSQASIRLLGPSVGAAGWWRFDAADIDGDLRPELVIGVTSGNSHGSYSGSSYVVRGTTTGTTLLQNAPARFEGASTNDYFGNAVLLLDINHDAITDLLVGAYGNDENGSKAGKIYAWDGLRF